MSYIGYSAYFDPESVTRNIFIKAYGMTAEQKRMQRYQDCYHGRLFDQPGRRFDWGCKWDVNGYQLSRKMWKPLCIPSIAKEIIHTHEAYLFGEDKFPTINVTKEGVDNNTEIQEYADNLFLKSGLKSKMQEMCIEVLQLKECPVVFWFYNGKPMIRVLDRKWCKITRNDNDPDEIMSLTEQYLMEEEPKNPWDEKKEYWFRRQINQTNWTEWKVPVDKNEDEIPEFKPAFITFDVEHNLGFCPAVMFEIPQAVFSDEIVNNIEGYIEFYNDIKSGIIKNMDPQRAILIDEDDMSLDGGEEDSEPLQRGALWKLKGRSLVDFAAQTAGYETALKLLEKEREEILRACFVISIPADNEQSGKALAMKMAPQYAAILKYRSCIGDGLIELCEKLLKAINIINPTEFLTDSELLKIPDYKNVQISLDWGDVFPVTEDSKAKMIDNASAAHRDGMISMRLMQRYIIPLFGQDDIEDEIRQIEEEREANRLNQVRLLAENEEKEDDEEEEE